MDIVDPSMQKQGNLTGRKRHRLGLFKRLVLQVEVRHYVSDPDDIYVYDTPGTGWRTYWRDATVNDISEGELV